MVLLSVCICTRQGKALVSRQFVEMNRLRVEGLIAAFPKLMDGPGQQHTFVETDSVRYLYQPLEGQIYLVCITTKASNIVEDLSTLRLLAKVVPDVCGGLAEGNIHMHAFELIFAFDEVITSGGYRDEGITITSIRTNLLMDSHEEKMHNMIKQSKEDAAKEEMRKQAKSIQDRKMVAMRQDFAARNGINGPEFGAPGGMPSGGMEGFGGGGYGNGDGMGGGYGNGYTEQSYTPQPSAPEPPRVAVRGLKLGGGVAASKKNSLMEAFAMEDNLKPISSGMGSAPAAPAAPTTPATLTAEEKMTVLMNREGGVETCEIKGTLSLTANNEEASLVGVTVNKAALSSCTSNWTFATHPKVNKGGYEQNGVLALKDTRKGFPVNRPVGILRWSYNAADGAPITVNCWPEDDGTGNVNVSIEFELTRFDMTLHDVNIMIPLGTTAEPQIESIDGNYRHDPREGILCWHHDVIDSNYASGSLDFAVSGTNAEAFFPVMVSFQSKDLLCPLDVQSVAALSNGSPVGYTLQRVVTPETYQCA